MKKKVKEFLNNVAWYVKGFLRQPVVPKKSVEWVIAHEGSYDGSNDKYAFYWIGNFKKGYTVKVSKKENDAYIVAYKTIFEEEN